MAFSIPEARGKAETLVTRFIVSTIIKQACEETAFPGTTSCERTFFQIFIKGTLFDVGLRPDLYVTQYLQNIIRKPTHMQ